MVRNVGRPKKYHTVEEAENARRSRMRDYMREWRRRKSGTRSQIGKPFMVAPLRSSTYQSRPVQVFKSAHPTLGVGESVVVDRYGSIYSRIDRTVSNYEVYLIDDNEKSFLLIGTYPEYLSAYYVAKGALNDFISRGITT